MAKRVRWFSKEEILFNIPRPFGGQDDNFLAVVDAACAEASVCPTTTPIDSERPTPAEMPRAKMNETKPEMSGGSQTDVVKSSQKCRGTQT